MNLRKMTASTLVLVLLTAVAVVPAFAGGWAVITLDSLPEGVQAGKAFVVGFTVRQHGVTPLANLDPAPVLQARNAATGRTVQATAMDEGAPGHYAAQLTLPSAGEWSWGIEAFGAQQPMPSIVVAAGGPASGTASVPALLSLGSVAGVVSQPASIVLALLAAGLAIAGIALALRRRYVFSGAALLLAALAAGAWFGVAEPSPAVAEAAPLSLPTDAGADLFVAKGCVVCHVNDRIAESQQVSHSIGPNLTLYANDPAFLAAWLKDPGAVRPATQMPDLGLSLEEIESLIAFLNGGPDA